MDFNFVICFPAILGNVNDNNNKYTKDKNIMQLTLPHLVMITAALLIAHSIIWA